MTKSNSTKKALVLALLSTLLCVSMLIGTTFAWFTDTASTAVNKIQAGNLKVELVKEDDSKLTEALKWVSAEEGATILWEPGCTYNLEGFKVKNSGTLALKYKVVISGVNGDAKLLDVLTFTYTVNGEAFTSDSEFKLAAGETSPVFAISAHMDETVGNEYKGLELDGITITVYATQDTVESDGNGNDYDADATYPVVNADELKAALANGGILSLGGNLDPKEAFVATKKTTINMNGNTIANTADVWDVVPNSWSLVSAQDGAELTITGNGTFQAKENDCYAVDVQDGSTVTIKNGTFIGNIHAVYVEEGTAIIEGGFFSVQQKYPNASMANEFVLNCYDANREANTAKIIVKGGTFVNFNPADCYAEGAHTNFVADGYKVVSETQANGDVWYTVVAE